MLKKIGLVSLLIVLVAAGALTVAAYKYGMIFNPSPSAPPDEKSVYDFTVKNIDGQDVKLDKYKGSVVMIVNTASKCGYTPQYEALEAVYEKYKDKGLVILGFPANNFMGQEPGTDTEIKEFCKAKYGVKFPMFAKISVKGADQHPLYNFLTNKKSDPQFAGDITWNFNKFLLDRQGNIVARFETKVTPDSEAVTAALEKLLAAK